MKNPTRRKQGGHGIDVNMMLAEVGETVIFEHLFWHVGWLTFTVGEKMEEKEGRKACWGIIVNGGAQWSAWSKTQKSSVFYIPPLELNTNKQNMTKKAQVNIEHKR